MEERQAQPTAKLDAKDRQIIYELDWDARQSFNSIGRKVRLSKEVVNYRVKRLLELGVLKGFYTVIDLTKLGYMSYRVYFKLLETSPEEQAKMVESLKAMQGVWWLCSFTGGWDLAFASWASSNSEFGRLWGEILEKYRRNIMNERISIYRHIYHFPRTYLLGRERAKEKAIITGGEERADYDELDFRILQAIAVDARAPTVQIAQKVGSNATVVAYRIKRMEQKGIIKGYRAMLDLEKLGVLWYKLVFSLRSLERKGEMMRWARGHPRVMWVFDTVGGWDLELEGDVHSMTELYGVLDSFRSRFAKDIRTFDYFLVYKEHKLVYMPAQRSSTRSQGSG